MQTKIAAGETLETLTQEELRTVLEELASGYLRDPFRDRIDAGGTTTAGGALQTGIYKPKQGYRFRLQRLAVIVDGYTYASPYNPGTQGCLQILRGTRNANLVVDGYAFGGSTGGTLPATYVESSSKAIDVVSGEELYLQVVGGPASKSVSIIGHGQLEPLEIEV